MKKVFYLYIQKMISKSILCLLIAFFTSGHLFADTQQAEILVDSINLRKSINKNSKKVGVVYKGYTYDVLDSVASHYKIRLPNNTSGWVYTNSNKGWVTYEKSKREITITHTEALSVTDTLLKSKKTIGYAPPGFSFPVDEVKYQYLKIKTPAGEIGWVYTGTVETPYAALITASQDKLSTSSTNTKSDRSVTLENVYFENGSTRITVRPGQRFSGSAKYNHNTSVDYSKTQIILGYDGLGAQACIYDGKSSGVENANFELTAPSKPGRYDLKLLYTQAHNCKDALNWWPIDSAPNKASTVGQVFVTKPTSSGRWSNKMLRWKPSPFSWRINGKHLSIAASDHYLKDYYLESKDVFNNIETEVLIRYRKRANSNLSSWHHARGFGLIYLNDNTNLLFRYFPDVKQASLYINDSNGHRELIKKPLSLKENKWHSFYIKVDKGKITWHINDNVLFHNVITDDFQGRLKLVSTNNHTDFRFKDFQTILD